MISDIFDNMPMIVDSVLDDLEESTDDQEESYNHVCL